MPFNTILRLLFAFFLLYFAWPYIPEATTSLEQLFWGAWLLFFLFVVGGNFSTLLSITSPPPMEIEEIEKLKQKQGSHL